MWLSKMMINWQKIYHYTLMLRTGANGGGGVLPSFHDIAYKTFENLYCCYSFEQECIIGIYIISVPVRCVIYHIL